MNHLAQESVSRLTSPPLFSSCRRGRTNERTKGETSVLPSIRMIRGMRLMEMLHTCAAARIALRIVANFRLKKIKIKIFATVALRWRPSKMSFLVNSFSTWPTCKWLWLPSQQQRHSGSSTLLQCHYGSDCYACIILYMYATHFFPIGTTQLPLLRALYVRHLLYSLLRCAVLPLFFFFLSLKDKNLFLKFRFLLPKYRTRVAVYTHARTHSRIRRTIAATRSSGHEKERRSHCCLPATATVSQPHLFAVTSTTMTVKQIQRGTGPLARPCIPLELTIILKWLLPRELTSQDHFPISSRLLEIVSTHKRSDCERHPCWHCAHESSADRLPTIRH